MNRTIILLSCLFAITLNAAREEGWFYIWDQSAAQLRISWSDHNVYHGGRRGEDLRVEKVQEMENFIEVTAKLLRKGEIIQNLVIDGTNHEIASILKHLGASKVKIFNPRGHPSKVTGAYEKDFDELIEAVVTNLPALKVLSFFHFERNHSLQPKHLERLHALKLTSLHADFVDNPGGGTMIYGRANQLIPAISHLKDSLEELSVGKETWITEAKAVHALASLTNLKKLTVRGPISPEAVDAIKNLKLTHLDLRGANRMDYTHVLLILEHCADHLQVFAFPNYPLMQRYAASVTDDWWRYETMPDGYFESQLESLLPQLKARANWALKAVFFRSDHRKREEFEREVVIFESVGIKVIGKTESYLAGDSEEWKSLWNGVPRTTGPVRQRNPAPTKVESVARMPVYLLVMPTAMVVGVLIACAHHGYRTHAKVD